MAATCTFYEKEGARASCRHGTLCNFGGLLRKAFLHPTDRMCLLMLRPIYTQSCGKETPCGKSPSHTRIGSQALLDRLVFRGAANDPEMFSVANRQEKIQLRSQITPMHVLKVLRALTYVATKPNKVESLTFHTYTSSPGKILLINPRILQINQDQDFRQIGFRPDTGENRTAGSH